MKLPEITVKKTKDKYKVISLEHCYGEFTAEDEANRLASILNQYRDVATMDLICQGLDGESSKLEPEFLPLTQEQLTSLCSHAAGIKFLVHPASGAVFRIKSFTAETPMSQYSQENITVEIITVNGT